MAPHCDTMDGPVVSAAEMALEMEDVNYVLPFVPQTAENELIDAFDKTIAVRELSEDVGELADYWFFETTVRLHRKGEGKPYEGLKPGGLDWGPVISKAEKAIEEEDPKKVIDFLNEALYDEIQKRFQIAVSLKDYNVNDVYSARKYVNAMLDFVLYSHHLYKYMKQDDHK
ncbi:MAG: hypothetical protein HZC47_02280 [Methanobacterium sp.]|uniref:DUF6448 family protein n=1 Tax=Methanobacterium sp. TaxID=2164 RepID=UPI003D6585B3|nr:hypothetical protein [Methanobacterium sp.]